MLTNNLSFIKIVRTSKLSLKMIRRHTAEPFSLFGVNRFPFTFKYIIHIKQQNITT